MRPPETASVVLHSAALFTAQRPDLILTNILQRSLAVNVEMCKLLQAETINISGIVTHIPHLSLKTSDSLIFSNSNKIKGWSYGFFSLMNGSLNIIILITSEDVDFLNLLPLFLQCGSDDNQPTNSSLLQKVPEVTVHARAGNWKINLLFSVSEGTFSTCLQAGLRWQRHLSVSATLLPVCD